MLVGQDLSSVSAITFTKQTRAYLEEVVVTPDSVHGVVENHRLPQNSKKYDAAIDTDQWARFMLALQNVSLEDIDGLRSPTTNRAHDAAMHSSLVITLKDGSSVTHSFDDEKPHPDLQPLLDAILELRAW